MQLGGEGGRKEEGGTRGGGRRIGESLVVKGVRGLVRLVRGLVRLVRGLVRLVMGLSWV